MSEMVCYCHSYTDDDIREDIRKNGGHSLILDQIVAEKKKGTCRCSQLHPESR